MEVSQHFMLGWGAYELAALDYGTGPPLLITSSFIFTLSTLSFNAIPSSPWINFPKTTYRRFIPPPCSD